MRIEVLRWFAAVAEREHLGEAALDLNISQPALSRAIAGLEEEIGAPLFARTGRRLTLNKNGRVYLAAVERSLDELDNAQREIALGWSRRGGTVRLGVLHTVGEWLMPGLIADFTRIRPEVRFDLSQDAASQIVASVMNGNTDLGIVGPEPEAPLAWFELAVESVDLVVPADHGLATRRSVSLAEIGSETLVLLKAGYGLRTTIDRLFEASRLSPTIAYESENMYTLLGLVGQGLGVTLCPPLPHAMLESRGLRVVALDAVGAQRSLGVIWPTGRVLAPASEAFLQHLRDHGPSLARAASGPRQ